ncbi:MAG TPA: hypothetical protein VJ302_07330 [Blastocatellia bacterium]|nr:hypothetical protein [Blastocatellia bacterium]
MESFWKNLTRVDFPRQFWALARLRYCLIWAHARTGNGKIALLFALYMLGGLMALFFSFGGFGLALGIINSGGGEKIARWVLASLFANGIGLSLLFGLGPREAFSEEALRRYPLNAQERFAVRHGIGLLDPIWLILVAGAFGLAGGFIWLGTGSLMTGLPAVFLFIIANYLTTATLLSVIGILLQTRAGSALLGTAVILLVSFGPLAVASVAATHREEVWRLFDVILEVTPPGAAAAMMAGEDGSKLLGGLGLLLFWCIVLIYALSRIENRSPVSPVAAAGNITWNDFYDQLGNLLGGKYGPLLSKSLRYHLRCNLIRFSLITSPIIVLMGKFLIPSHRRFAYQNGEGIDRFFLVSLAMFFIMSSATGAALMLNLFGYDNAGIRRYAILPTSFADALRAGSLASLLLRAVTVLVAFALWLTFYATETVTWQMIVMILSIALASLFLFNTFGLGTSIFSPKRLDFDAMWNNRLSLGANLVIIGGILLPFWSAMVLAERINQEVFVGFWWLACLILVLCAGFYLFVLSVIDRPLRSRRERLINLIAGARDK